MGSVHGAKDVRRKLLPLAEAAILITYDFLLHGCYVRLFLVLCQSEKIE